MATDICGVIMFANPEVGISLRCRVCRPRWQYFGFASEQDQREMLYDHLSDIAHYKALGERAWAQRMANAVAAAIERANPMPSRQVVG